MRGEKVNTKMIKKIKESSCRATFVLEFRTGSQVIRVCGRHFVTVNR